MVLRTEVNHVSVSHYHPTVFALWQVSFSHGSHNRKNSKVKTPTTSKIGITILNLLPDMLSSIVCYSCFLMFTLIAFPYFQSDPAGDQVNQVHRSMDSKPDSAPQD